MIHERSKIAYILLPHFFSFFSFPLLSLVQHHIAPKYIIPCNLSLPLNLQITNALIT
jgi:hypothetical protein